MNLAGLNLYANDMEAKVGKDRPSRADLRHIIHAIRQTREAPATPQRSTANLYAIPGTGSSARAMTDAMDLAAFQMFDAMLAIMFGPFGMMTTRRL